MPTATAILAAAGGNLAPTTPGLTQAAAGGNLAPTVPFLLGAVAGGNLVPAVPGLTKAAGGTNLAPASPFLAVAAAGGDLAPEAPAGTGAAAAGNLGPVVPAGMRTAESGRWGIPMAAVISGTFLDSYGNAMTFPVLVYAGEYNNRPSYSTTGVPLSLPFHELDGSFLYFDGAHWELRQHSDGYTAMASWWAMWDRSVTPDLAVGWSITSGGLTAGNPAIIVTGWSAPGTSAIAAAGGANLSPTAPGAIA